ncbi:hypothetical protein THRCLA_06388 [Thraustotheca clavata]|uniref:C2 domain-containing protein n=1 Tax=Thraustotheca clavata TaxID=74557 RepID=A0A1V9ZP99_9STRA|nr:hypothetical protein THRCLA_06388 [Thraustotheca clavata]
MSSISLDIALPLTANVSSTYGSQSSTIVPSEYYYVLIFPNTPHALNAGATSRISFLKATNIVRSVTCGSTEAKDAAVAEFEQAWITKFRSLPPVDNDMIPVHFFQELIRVIVIQRLEANRGIALVTQIAQDESSIYCYIRLTRDYLFQAADRFKINLPIWPEIDPGSEYWMDYGHETKEYSIEAAEKQLHRMFLAGQINADEAQVFLNESSAMVSRRIAAMLRICDRDIQKYYTSSATMYFPFQNDPAYHYLYRHVEGIELDMPFRRVDKIRLTKAVLDEAFNCDMLEQRGFLNHHMCIHTYSQEGDDAALEHLREQWGALSAPVFLYQNKICRDWRLIFYQPITMIRDYFGEQLALYFAFLTFYAEKMLILIVIGLVDPWLTLLLPEAIVSYYNIVLAGINIGYTCYILREWNVKQQEYACAWGMDDVKADTSVRPEYNGSIRLNPVTNTPEIYSPPSIQITKKVYSTLMLIVAIGVNSALIYGVFAIQDHLESKFTSFSFVEWSYVGIALLINLSQIPFHYIVVFLNTFENHRTFHDYDVSLTVKFTLFQTINNFGPIVFSNFFKPYFFGCNRTKFPDLDAASCASETQNLLLVVLLFNLFLSIRDIATPLFHAARQAYKKSVDKYMTLVVENSATDIPVLDTELELEQYEGVLFDYAQISITFGYIAWFAALAPIASAIALAITAAQIRVDAYKLCFLMQRPFPTPAATIGGWMIYFRMLNLSGVVVNAGNVIIAQTLSDQAKQSLSSITVSNWLDQLFKFTILMTLLYIFSFLLSLNDANDREVLHMVKSTLKRQAHLVETYLYQLTTAQTSVCQREPGAIYLNGVYRYIVSGDVEDCEQVEELREELFSLEKSIRNFPKNDQEQLGMLYVIVVGANILPAVDRTTKSIDAFIKVKLKQGEKILPSKAKTSVKKKQRSPVWNAAFEFKITSMETALFMEIMDWNLVGRSKCIGTASVPITRALPSATDFDDKAVEGICDMVALDVPIEMEESLLVSMNSDISKHGRPVIHVSMGLRINALGCEGLRYHNYVQRANEITKEMDSFLVWKSKEV